MSLTSINGIALSTLSHLNGVAKSSLSQINGQFITNPYFLDAIGSSASVAYGLRKLRSAYAGSCVRVRRASDNTESDIGFSGEDMDWAGAISFMGASSLTVKVWYDQSGNGINVQQTTNSAQPSLDTTNEEIDFNGSSQYLSSASTIDLSGGNVASWFLISRSSNTANYNIHFEHGTGTVGQHELATYHTSGNQLFVQQQDASGINTDVFNTFANGAYRLIFASVDRALSAGAQTAGRINASAMTDATTVSRTGNFGNKSLYVGVRNGSSFWLNGSMRELVLFPSALGSTAITTGESNVNAFYSIY